MDRRASTLTVLTAATAGAVLSGAPSTLECLVRERSVRAAYDYAVEATRAAGTVLPPGRPGFVKGAAVHGGLSLFWATVLVPTLPHKHTVAWGAAAGLGIGVVSILVIGRRFPAILALRTGPQLADNVAFGVVVGAVVAARRRQTASANRWRVQ